jgi:hypothetical protein
MPISFTQERFVIDRVQRSLQRLIGREVNVEGIVAADELALRHVLDRQMLLLGQGRYIAEHGVLG